MGSILAQVTEPSDYVSVVTDAVSGFAAQAWPIVLAVLLGIIGITLAVLAFQWAMRHFGGLVGGYNTDRADVNTRYRAHELSEEGDGSDPWGLPRG